jgi:hypothetical protein
VRLSSLDQTNGLIGFCRKLPGWPAPLQPFGYEVAALELNIVLARDEEVSPDLILSSDSLRHAVAFELKEGANIDIPQARKLAKLKASHLRDRGITVGSSDTSIVVDDADRAKAVSVMDREEIPLAVFGMTATRFVLRRGSLTHQPTQRALEDVDLRRQVVPRFIQVLPNATDKELLGPLSAILAEALLRSERHVDLDSLAQSLFPGGLWSTISPQYQGSIRNKIQNVMAQLTAKAFRGKVERAPGSRWKLSPPAGSGTGSVQAYRAIQRKVLQTAKGRIVIAKEQMLLPIEDIEDAESADRI